MITESIVIGILALVVIYQGMRIRALKKKLKTDQLKPSEELSGKIIIDCAAPPFVPRGWSVAEHQPRDKQYQFDPARIFLYQSRTQAKESVKGNELKKELEDKSTLNANVLDYLFAHPRLIPEEWKGKLVFFFGTIYRDSNGLLCVRCLNWDDSEWRWHCSWLGHGFYSDCFSAVAS